MLLSGVLGSLYLYTSSSAGNGELEMKCQSDRWGWLGGCMSLLDVVDWLFHLGDFGKDHCDNRCFGLMICAFGSV